MDSRTSTLLLQSFLQALGTTLIVACATISPLVIGAVVLSFTEVSDNGEFFIYGISLLAGSFSLIYNRQSVYQHIFSKLYQVIIVLFIIILIVGYIGFLVNSNSIMFGYLKDNSALASCLAAILYLISQWRLNYKILDLEDQREKLKAKQKRIDTQGEEREANTQELKKNLKW